MNPVISLNVTCDRDVIVRLFARFSNKYGNLWTTRLGPNPDWEFCIDDWYSDLKAFDYKTIVKAAKACFEKHPDYPPTFGQFYDLCQLASGFLQFEDACKMLVVRDFSHPIVKMMYDKIGDWALRNSREADLVPKQKEAYADAKAEFSLYPDKCWTMLESFNVKPKTLPEPAKIPSTEEKKGFKERLNECQRRLEEEKIRPGGKTYREFDEKKINPTNADFDKAVYDEYRVYLLSIAERDTIILSPKYVYQRMRFLAERERPELLRRAGYVRPSDREVDSSLKTSDKKSGTQKPFKSWND